MELLGVFGQDLDKSNDGVWVPLVDVAGEKGRMRICRMWNPRFKEAFRKHTEAITAREGRILNDEESEEIMVKCIAETILIDWEDIRVAGEVLVYSVKNAIKLLSDPRLEDFREKVTTESSSFSNYRLENLEESSGK